MKSKLISIPYTVGIIKPHVALRDDKVSILNKGKLIIKTKLSTFLRLLHALQYPLPINFHLILGDNRRFEEHFVPADSLLEGAVGAQAAPVALLLDEGGVVGLLPV